MFDWSDDESDNEFDDDPSEDYEPPPRSGLRLKLGKRRPGPKSSKVGNRKRRKKQSSLFDDAVSFLFMNVHDFLIPGPVTKNKFLPLWFPLTHNCFLNTKDIARYDSELMLVPAC